jgi:transposase
LREELDYDGAYDAVRRYVKSRRSPSRETFLPISVEAGQRAEADFGQIEVDFPDGRRSVSVLLITWAYSGAVFAIALPSEKVESILHGTVQAFEFFGCVPRELWWDNPRTVAKSILQGRRRELNTHYRALASHYNFEPLFCLPARGNEKPHVEGRVKWLKRNWATPVPRVNDLEELNAYLRRCCEQDFARTMAGKTGTIGARFEAERDAALCLPRFAFDACVNESREVDKYQTVAWEGNRYSVPRQYAFGSVTVKAYVDSIEVVGHPSTGSRPIARHERSYGKGEMLLDPLHYLAILDRKPAYLDHTDVYKNWRLPTEIAGLREQFELRYGPQPGARKFIQVLQLLAEHPQQRIVEAIAHCTKEGALTPQRIIFKCGEFQLRPAQHGCSPRTTDGKPSDASDIPQVSVPVPDLSRFDSLLPRSVGVELEQNGLGNSRPPMLQSAVDAHVDSMRCSCIDCVSAVSKLPLTQGGEIHGTQKNEPTSRGVGTEIESQATSLADHTCRASEAGHRSCQHQPGLPDIFTASDGVRAGHSFFQCSTDSHSFGQLSHPERSGYI